QPHLPATYREPARNSSVLPMRRRSTRYSRPSSSPPPISNEIPQRELLAVVVKLSVFPETPPSSLYVVLTSTV
ncbi:unnamed protein product, partial [Ectocarpus fasciculatus]